MPYAENYQTFNDAINCVINSRERCFDMVKECKENDDIHYFKKIEIQITDKNFSDDETTFKKSKTQIESAYYRAIRNMLWYFDRLGCLGQWKKELLKCPFYDGEQPSLIKWTTTDGRELSYRTEGAEYSTQTFSLDSSYTKANMNLFELAQLLVKVIKAKEDHLNACYSEFVYLSIENIITGGGCYRGYVNRLMASILFAYDQ